MPDEPIDRILDAAYACFTRHGMRRTTMDDIAAAAGMSRPAVYQYVKNKNDVFLRLAGRLFGAALTKIKQADAPGRPLDQRLVQILTGKLDLTFRLLQDSPHAAELLDEGARLSGAVVEEFTTAIRQLLTRAIAEAAATGEITLAGAEPADIAHIAMTMTHGLEDDLADIEGLRRRLALGVELLVAGLAKRNRAAS